MGLGVLGDADSGCGRQMIYSNLDKTKEEEIQQKETRRPGEIKGEQCCGEKASHLRGAGGREQKAAERQRKPSSSSLTKHHGSSPSR